MWIVGSIVALAVVIGLAIAGLAQAKRDEAGENGESD